MSQSDSHAQPSGSPGGEAQVEMFNFMVLSRTF